MSREFDLVVRGGDVVDGSGGPAFPADIGISGGRIAAIGLASFLFAMFTGCNEYNLEPVRETLAHPNALIGLGDGGAHVGFITDASFPTFLLTYWGRDRESGTYPVEELVRRYTSDPADAVGLHDRGVIRAGLKADLNLIDIERLKLEKLYIVSDLPAGGKRLMQKAQGYRMSILSGQVTYENGVDTGARPGRLVRGPQRAHSQVQQLKGS